MSDVVPKIGLAIEGYKARQQDIIGLGHRAYKDLFSAANASMLTFCRPEIDSAFLFGIGHCESSEDFVAGGCFTTTRRDYCRLPRADGGRWHSARVDRCCQRGDHRGLSHDLCGKTGDSGSV